LNFVLDASTVVAWIFRDERSDYADRVQSSLIQSEAVVPWIWPYEVTNALIVAERRGRIESDTVASQLALLDRLPVTIDQTSPATERIAELAQRYQRTAYDALYLELALRHGLAVATLDGGLRQACVEAGVVMYEPS